MRACSLTQTASLRTRHPSPSPNFSEQSSRELGHAAAAAAAAGMGPRDGAGCRVSWMAGQRSCQFFQGQGQGAGRAEQATAIVRPDRTTSMTGDASFYFDAQHIVRPGQITKYTDLRDCMSIRPYGVDGRSVSSYSLAKKRKNHKKIMSYIKQALIVRRQAR